MKKQPTFKEYFLLESLNDKGIFKAVFIVGIPGAGKSYTVKQLAGPISPKVINTDRATEFLSKKFNMSANAKTWRSFFRDRTKPLTVNMLAGYLNGMLPLFIDGTSSDTSNIFNRAGILESLGYDVGMVFINTSLDIAQERAARRGAEIDRHVSVDFINQVHEVSEENREYFKGKFKFYKEVNNNPGELDDAAILQIYRKVAGFYNEAVDNPVGRRTIQKLIDSKEKYLIPSILEKEELKKKIDSWYR